MGKYFQPNFSFQSLSIANRTDFVKVLCEIALNKQRNFKFKISLYIYYYYYLKIKTNFKNLKKLHLCHEVKILLLNCINRIKWNLTYKVNS